MVYWKHWLINSVKPNKRLRFQNNISQASLDFSITYIVIHASVPVEDRFLNTRWLRKSADTPVFSTVQCLHEHYPHPPHTLNHQSTIYYYTGNTPIQRTVTRNKRTQTCLYKPKLSFSQTFSIADGRMPRCPRTVGRIYLPINSYRIFPYSKQHKNKLSNSLNKVTLDIIK